MECLRKMEGCYSFMLILYIYLLQFVSAGLWQYGNMVQERNTYLQKGARKAWVDMLGLPEGHIQQFELYAHPISSKVENVTVRLQIWKPYSIENNIYQLRWEKPVRLDQGMGRKYIFLVDNVKVLNGDRIGWTFEGDIGPISYEHTQSHHTHFLPISSYPQVNLHYRFSPITLPATFSVAVLLKQDGDNRYTTQPTTTTTTEAPIFYGNEVTMRKMGGPTSARKSWLDVNNKLPSGMLEKFSFYVHENVTLAPVRLQIWCPQDSSENSFKLRWEKRVPLDKGFARKYEFEVEDVFVNNGDIIGWTVETHTGPLSFDYVNDHFTYFRTIHNNEYPVVGESYNFASVQYPSIFSVGVTVRRGVHPSPSSKTKDGKDNFINGATKLDRSTSLQMLYGLVIAYLLSYSRS